MMYQKSFIINTSGRELINITNHIVENLAPSEINQGLCNIFLHHTSASLILCENHEGSVLHDLENFMQRLIPDGDKLFTHTTEGPDDMSAHVRTVLTQCSLTVPITEGKLALGKWQGIFLWEHRFKAHTRKITLTAFS